MSIDDKFENELRLQFSMLEVPELSAGALEEATRRFRRWRLRRRLLIATPGVAAAATLGVALSLAGFGGLGAGSIRLTNYIFPLPSGFHVTASVTQACQTIVRFTEEFHSTTGMSAETLLKNTGARSYTTEAVASAANANDGCVQMALTGPFTPKAATGNPSDALNTSSSARRVDVAGHVGWLTTSQTHDGLAILQLTVELPQSDGQVRDLGVGASGLTATELLAIVSQGLS